MQSALLPPTLLCLFGVTHTHTPRCHWVQASIPQVQLCSRHGHVCDWDPLGPPPSAFRCLAQLSPSRGCSCLPSNQSGHAPAEASGSSVAATSKHDEMVTTGDVNSKGRSTHQTPPSPLIALTGEALARDERRHGQRWMWGSGKLQRILAMPGRSLRGSALLSRSHPKQQRAVLPVEESELQPLWHAAQRSPLGYKTRTGPGKRVLQPSGAIATCSKAAAQPTNGRCVEELAHSLGFPESFALRALAGVTATVKGELSRAWKGEWAPASRVSTT